ncbi:MAG: helix-turn-helix transcriptional regulator [Lachnospiraceae bacterium]|nr:helix-turn-helix transcriptional regulator [Lachnospiraceae bacterium]
MANVTNRFSIRLKELRETAGLTQAELAEELKVSRGAISYYEKAERTPDIAFLDAVSDLFGVSFDFLLGYSNNINRENADMDSLYGLSDAACDLLDHAPHLGRLISKIIEHKDFADLTALYKEFFAGLLDDTLKSCPGLDSIPDGRCKYICFLISERLNNIIFDSVVSLNYEKISTEELQEMISWYYKNHPDKKEEMDSLLKQEYKPESEEKPICTQLQDNSRATILKKIHKKKQWYTMDIYC